MVPTASGRARRVGLPPASQLGRTRSHGDLLELAPHRIVRLEDDAVVVLDQRRLPDEEVELRCRDGGGARRGDPGARGARRAGDRRRRRLRDRARGRARRGPRRGVRDARRVAADRGQPPLGARRDARRPDARSGPSGSTRTRSSAAGAMGAHAVELFPAGARVLTHCNAGGLATGGYGTALGAIRAAREAGRRRARLGRRDAAAAPGRAPDRLGARAARDPARRDRRRRGGARSWRAARSTSWSPAPTGSPRTATRRTRSAPTRSPCSRATTASRSSSSRRPRRSTRRRRPAPTIPIEERDRAEVTARFAARNPAFDVTPGELIAAIVTEQGVHRAPYADSLPARGRGRSVILDEVDPGTRAVLERFGFEPDEFEVLRARVASRRRSRPRRTSSAGVVEPPRDADLVALPEPGLAGLARRARAGSAALASGRIAQVVLAGGMATRFGGVVKGAVEALDGRSFLSWKLGETARLGAGARRADPGRADDELPDRRRDARTRRRAGRSGAALVLAARVAPADRGAASSSWTDGAPSLYAPGHGDLLGAIRHSGTLAELQRLRRRARRGLERRQPRRPPRPGGRRGAPPRRRADDGRGRGQGRRPRAARPPGSTAGSGCSRGRSSRRSFDQGRIPVFNTNTALTATRRARPRLRSPRGSTCGRRSDERVAVQLERLYHQRRGSSRRPTSRCRAPGRAGGSSRSRSRRTSIASPRRCARCSTLPSSRSHEADTIPARCRHSSARLAWKRGTSRPRAPHPLRRVRRPRCRPVRAVCGGARPHRAARLRAVRLPRRVARAALRRVRRPAARLRDGARRDRLRRACTTARLGVEGAWAPRSRAAARGDRRRRARPAGRRRVTFVPGDRERGRARGHVPAARLARRARSPLGAAGRPQLLARAGRHRAAGAGCPRRAAANVAAASSPPSASAARVVLVDDVYTTGATAAACATALRRAGARRVEVVCLARAVR